MYIFLYICAFISHKNKKKTWILPYDVFLWTLLITIYNHIDIFSGGYTDMITQRLG